MEIKPSEVAEIKTVGKLFDDDVKLIRTVGGFYLFVGKKEKSAKKAGALAGTSHPAIGLHQIQKDFGSDFQPAIAKSEADKMPEVQEKSTYLPKKDIDAGIDLYVLKSENNVAVILYKRGITLGKYIAKAENDSLVLTKRQFSYKGDKNTATAISKAIKDVAHDMNLSKIKKRWQ